MNNNHYFNLQVLDYFAKKELCSMLYWETDGDPITSDFSVIFYINTNDLLYWGCADAEEITPENFDSLKKAVDDCEKIDIIYGEMYGLELFACQQNGMRPQGACYPKNKELWPLFDACGPEREVGFGNPYKPGEYPR